MTKAGIWVNSVIASLSILVFVSAAGFFGYKWLASDEANRSYACGSGNARFAPVGRPTTATARNAARSRDAFPR